MDRLPCLLFPVVGTAGAELKVPSTENPELPSVLSFRPRRRSEYSFSCFACWWLLHRMPTLRGKVQRITSCLRCFALFLTEDQLSRTICTLWSGSVHRGQNEPGFLPV